VKHENSSIDDTENKPCVSSANSYAPSAESGVPKQPDSIGAMEPQLVVNRDLTEPSAATESDWIASAIKAGRMLSSKEVAVQFGFKSRASFYSFVAKEGVPIIRLTRRNIKFPPAALQRWMDKRDSTKGLL
jgi:predicted DNA-binding transcriptional regulator AlpA